MTFFHHVWMLAVGVLTPSKNRIEISKVVDRAIGGFKGRDSRLTTNSGSFQPVVLISTSPDAIIDSTIMRFCSAAPAIQESGHW